MIPVAKIANFGASYGTGTGRMPSVLCPVCGARVPDLRAHAERWMAFNKGRDDWADHLALYVMET